MVKVIKVGGGILESEESTQAFLDAFCQIEGPKVLVHGGGRLATTIGERMGIKSQMIEGRRITDEATLQIVTMVYGGLVNKNIVAKLQARGVNAIGLTGADMNYMQASKRPPKNGIDYGYAGDVTKTNGEALRQLLSMGMSPVIAPLTHDGKGLLLNTNADTIAMETARSLAPEAELIYCFGKAGILRDINDPNSVIPTITPELYKQLKEEGVISDGMIPKTDNAFNALQSGIKQVRITSYTQLDGGTVIKC